MNRKQAHRALGIAPSADAEMVEHAYRHLTRKYQAEANHDDEAEARLDELKEAYTLLTENGSAPTARRAAADAPPLAPAEPPLPDLLRQWMRQVLAATRARWRGRLPEISILAATTLVLAAMALFAGASLPWTIIVLLVAAVTILAPWRPTSGGA